MSLIVSDITQVRRQIASLSNSASWLSLTTASVSTGAPTALTTQASEPVFTSTAVDKGKQLVIRGAGASGADLYTSLTAVGSSTSATIADNASTTVSNALAAFGGDADDDRHSLVEIDEAMFETDESLVLAILETDFHWAKGEYLTLSGSIAYGAQIPSHVGVPQILIQKAQGESFVGGIPSTQDAIQRYRANTGVSPNNVYGSTASTASGSPLSGYFYIDGDSYLWYTGYDAKARLYQFARSTTALQSPNVYQSGVIAGALMKLLLKDGDDPSAAGAWGKLYQDSLAMVRMGVRNAQAA